MSNKLLTALRQYQLPAYISQPSSTRCLLYALADRANDNYTCFPSIKTLAFDTHMSERNVQRCLANLRRIGVLRTAQRFNGSNEYQFHYYTIGGLYKGHPNTHHYTKKMTATEKKIWINILNLTADKHLEDPKPSLSDIHSIKIVYGMEPQIVDSSILKLFTEFVNKWIGGNMDTWNPLERFVFAVQKHKGDFDVDIANPWEEFKQKNRPEIEIEYDQSARIQ